MLKEATLESQEIRKAGLKVTLPRVKILEILEQADSPSHLTAEDVYKALLDRQEDIGLATVYRVLTQFVSAGLAERHHFESGQAVFELNRGTHHDHIVCMQCGKVEEFFDESLEATQKAIAKKKGFDISDHSLVIYGSCRRRSCPNKKD